MSWKIMIKLNGLTSNQILTDRQTNREIVLAINSLIFEECEEIDEDMKWHNQFENLSINSYSDISQKVDYYQLFEDPFKSLLWRSKSALLAFL